MVHSACQLLGCIRLPASSFRLHGLFTSRLNEKLIRETRVARELWFIGSRHYFPGADFSEPVAPPTSRVDALFCGPNRFQQRSQGVEAIIERGATSPFMNPCDQGCEILAGNQRLALAEAGEIE